jgi:hypothetical protein
MTGAFVSWGVAVLYAIFMCCCWKQISLGASVMKAASDFVASNLRIIALPVISYLIAFAFFAFWVIAAVHIYSIGTAEFKENSFVANIKWDKNNWYMMWYFLFGLFWFVAFLICLQQFIIAAMTCMWYFSGQGNDSSDTKGTVSVLLAIKWGCWYHCGSIAFGSFLIALVTMIRVVFEYLVKQAQAANQDNAIVKGIMCCVTCMLYLLDKYVKFITKNAFIQIALHNKSFCESALAAFFLIIRNAGRFGSAGIIGWIIMMLGKGTIMGASAFLTIAIVQAKYPMVQQPFVPAIIIAAVAYIVGSLFLSIFSFSSTAILHCFLLDEELGGGKNTPESLKDFIDGNDEANAKTNDKKDDVANKVD